MFRVEWDAIDRAHLLALRFIVMPYAFRAQVRVYLVDLLPLGDSVVWAHRLTNVAVDAFIGNIKRQNLFLQFLQNRRFHSWGNELMHITAQLGHFTHQAG